MKKPLMAAIIIITLSACGDWGQNNSEILKEFYKSSVKNPYVGDNRNLQAIVFRKTLGKSRNEALAALEHDGFLCDAHTCTKIYRHTDSIIESMFGKGPSRGKTSEINSQRFSFKHLFIISFVNDRVTKEDDIEATFKAQTGGM